MSDKIGNVRFDKLTLNSSYKRLMEIIENGNRCHQVVVANAYSVVIAHKNKAFADVCETTDITFADGLPVVWLSSLIGVRIPERIAGPDFMWSFSGICAKKGYKVFLMGSEEPYLSRLATNMKRTFINMNIVGAYSPPYGKWSSEENKKMITMINKSKADILWVGVSSPKQDLWIAQNKDKLKVKVALGVGAAFDFHSGRVKRAPLWMQKVGLEWFYRLSQDPKRLWKRYLIGNLRFLGIIIKEFIKNKINF